MTFQQMLDSIPKQQQRQDSVQDQMDDLLQMATRLGMYDAADVIRTIVQKRGK